MLFVAFRKMLNNKGMLTCMLMGAIIVVAIISSIPTYTNGIMQRMLKRDLEISQQESGKYPGGYLVKYEGTYVEDSVSLFATLDKKINGDIINDIELPALAQCTYISAGIGQFSSGGAKAKASATIAGMHDLEQHIQILHGRVFSNRNQGDAYEVIASEQAMETLGLTLGNTYGISRLRFLDNEENKDSFKVKVVGIYSYKSTDDLFWFDGIEKYNETIFMNVDLLQEEFIQQENRKVYQAKWYFAYDYHKLSVDDLPQLVKTLDKHIRWFGNNSSSLSYEIQMEPIIQQYGERTKKLNTMLLVLQIPILAILAFYLYMVAQWKIDFESNEIAVMKSRGASSTIIFGIYMLESSAIGVVGLVVGPVIGLLLCQMMGASNGFLEFIQRSSLDLSFRPKTLLYCLGALIFTSISILIPALIACRTSIVLYKQKKSKFQKTTFWKRYCVDFLLLAISFYGMYGYQRQQKILFLSGLKGTEIEIDPLLFIVSVIFIFGSSLFVLRIFPYVIQLLFFAGKRLWGSVMYATFINVSRSSGKEQFAMIFIILTLAIGIFSSTAARTINQNVEEKIKYEQGADIVIQSNWDSSRAPDYMEVGMDGGGNQAIEFMYFEPPFMNYQQLEGVQSAARVFKVQNADVNIGFKKRTNVTVMGIDPAEFGKVAWFRSDLLPHHWYEYLNLMTDAPPALLVSSAFRDSLGAKEGDMIGISWGKNDDVIGIIYAFIDYWPSLNPNKRIEDEKFPYFIVANLNQICAYRPIEPYQVWLKKKPGASSNTIYRAIEDKGIELVYREDTSEHLIKQKMDPMLQGTNGSLTLGFIVTMIISMIGFLIYWIFSIRKRFLQFGIFRAMGLRTVKIVQMLMIEQFLITGSSILAGTCIGSLASRIFIPMLQLIYGVEEQVPPYKIVAEFDDFAKLYSIMGLILIISFVILGKTMVRMNVGQAIKLGED